MIRIVLAVFIACSATLPSAAETIATSYSYFSIGGSTLTELERDLNRRGPMVRSTGQRHPGATRMNFRTNVSYAEQNGRCWIAKAQVTLTAKVILPRWRPPRRADSDTRLVWDALSSDIKRHEDQHVRIARDYARQLERKLERIGRQRNCALATRKAKAVTDKVLSDHDRAQARFDMAEGAGFEKRLLRLMRQRARTAQSNDVSG
jgi:predicted secreted Zn-dependent protease